ncbi:MAG: hypothetical protein N2234_07650 [Planctomycetota bacterium]|nr:hypothetical protein [Planctomycetota bacterium]
MRWVIMFILTLVIVGCGSVPERKVITKGEYEEVIVKEEGR